MVPIFKKTTSVIIGLPKGMAGPIAILLKGGVHEIPITSGCKCWKYQVNANMVNVLAAGASAVLCSWACHLQQDQRESSGSHSKSQYLQQIIKADFVTQKLQQIYQLLFPAVTAGWGENFLLEGMNYTHGLNICLGWCPFLLHPDPQFVHSHPSWGKRSPWWSSKKTQSSSFQCS